MYAATAKNENNQFRRTWWFDIIIIIISSQFFHNTSPNKMNNDLLPFENPTCVRWAWCEMVCVFAGALRTGSIHTHNSLNKYILIEFNGLVAPRTIQWLPNQTMHHCRVYAEATKVILIRVCRSSRIFMRLPFIHSRSEGYLMGMAIMGTQGEGARAT